MSAQQKTGYWPLPCTGQDRGHILELRAMLAWELIHHFGSVAATDGGEDSGQRAKLVLQTPEQVVGRCFEIADLFVIEVEARGDIRASAMTEEEACARTGELQRIRSRAEYPVAETPAPILTAEELEMRSRHNQERAELRRKLEKAEKTS